MGNYNNEAYNGVSYVPVELGVDYNIAGGFG